MTAKKTTFFKWKGDQHTGKGIGHKMFRNRKTNCWLQWKGTGWVKRGCCSAPQNAFTWPVPHQTAWSANAGLQKTLGFFSFHRPAKAAAKAASPGAGSPAQPKENKRPPRRVRVAPHSAAPGREGSRPRAGDAGRSLPVGPTVIPAPDDAVRRRELWASAALSPLRAPAGSRPRLSLRGRWVRGRQGPRPGFVLPLALCRRGRTWNPGRPRQPRLLLLLLTHLLLLLLRSGAHDGGSRCGGGEQRRQQQHRYLQHGRGGEDEAPLPDLRRRWGWLHQQVATAGGGSLLIRSRPVLPLAPRSPALNLWASWSSGGSSAAPAPLPPAPEPGAPAGPRHPEVPGKAGEHCPQHFHVRLGWKVMPLILDFITSCPGQVVFASKHTKSSWWVI